MIELKGKRALGVGAASGQSIARGVPRALRSAAADPVVACLDETAETRVRPLALTGCALDVDAGRHIVG